MKPKASKRYIKHIFICNNKGSEKFSFYLPVHLIPGVLELINWLVGQNPFLNSTANILFSISTDDFWSTYGSTNNWYNGDIISYFDHCSFYHGNETSFQR